jgi:ADP-ribose pyrophosphatase YjhB (NUDIX family)
LERINRLRPNNALRDLTARWRLNPEFANNHHLLVNLETVCPEFRYKYPDPNLTLPAGSVEHGEEPYTAAHRELFEESRIRVHPAHVGDFIGLFRGGIKMFTVIVTLYTPLIMQDGVLYIGWKSLANTVPT